MNDKSNRGLGRILIRCSLVAKQRLVEMAAESKLAASVLVHRLIMREWERRYPAVWNATAETVKMSEETEKNEHDHRLSDSES